VQVADTGAPSFDIPGMPGGSASVINLSDMLGKAFGGRTKTRRMNVKASHEVLLAEESDKLLDQDQIVQEAIDVVENNGIVFLDEIDKICARSERQGADVSREGVQRDLLPLIEGTTVSTKHGPVKTDHILFIASGAFHIAKPSDLLPELQGRLPIRVELKALDRDDLKRILTEPEASLIKQYKCASATEGVTLNFSEDSISAIAGIAADTNASVENIGARRLQTVMERLLDEVSFVAPDRSGETVNIDAAYVENACRQSREERRSLEVHPLGFGRLRSSTLIISSSVAWSSLPMSSARRLASSVALGLRPEVSMAMRGCEMRASRTTSSASSQMMLK
jgi:ATP-dependent HslUV protease ATP-binding subunit HslU